MPDRLSQPQENRIIRLFFEGFSNAEIATQVMCSERTVRGRIAKFKAHAKEVGVKVAALKMEVSVDGLYDIAKYKRKEDVEFGEIWEGMQAASISKTLGCSPQDIRKFLELVVKVVARGYPAEDFARNAYALRDARDKLGKPYEQVVKDHMQLILELADTEYSIKTAEKEKKKAIEEQEIALATKDATIELLDEYINIRDSLKKYYIEIKELDKLSNLLRNLEPYYENHRELVEYYKQTQDAETRHQTKLKEVKEYEKSIQELSKENRELSCVLIEKKAAVETAQIFEETGITPTEAYTLSATLKQIAAKNNLPMTKAFTRLCQDLEDYYDLALGYENRLISLKEEYESKQRLFKELETSYTRLLEHNKNQLNAIQNLQALNSSGVGNQDLEEWTRIIDENNLDSHTLRHEIKKLDGIKQTTNKLTYNINKLNIKKQEIETELTRLEARQNQLNSYVEQVEGRIPGSISIFADTLTTYIDIMEGEILSPETGIKPRTDALVQETVDRITQTLKGYEKEWEKQHQTLADKIEESSATVAKLNEKSYEAGKIIGEVIHLESILKLNRGEKLDDVEANIAVLGLTSTLLNYLYSRGLDDSYNKLQAFIQSYSQEFPVYV